MNATPKTTVAKIIASSALGAALIGGGVGTAAYNLIDVPPRSEFTSSAPTRAIAHVEIDDPDDVLTATDEERMLRDAQRLTSTDTVQQLRYIVFAKNRSNVNDSVEEYLRDKHPELIDEKHFADGVLIVGVGLDPRQAFIFAGEDVADQLDLRKGSHLDASLEAIKPGVKDGNIPAGLFAGARAASDVEMLADAKFAEKQSDRTTLTIVGTALGGAAACTAIGAAGALRRKREKALIQAQEDLAFIGKEYGELAGRLDSIDIRAHSLTSPLAHQRMRAEWADVRDRFLGLHQQVDSFGNLTVSSDPKLILEQAPQISSAADTARQVSYAEENIDTLFRLEHGDATLRKNEVIELRNDIVAAQGSVKKADSGLFQALANARSEADSLLEHTEEAHFLERYAMLLRDYQSALATLRQEQFSDVEDKTSQPSAPTVYEQGYRPGYGYADFVPFWALNSWHSDAIETQNAASSSTNSSFSSGFSGAGGSSSF